MVYQYWVNLGQKRSTFLAFEGAYHGDTFGAMSAGKSLFNQAFSDLLFEVDYLPYPDTYIGDRTIDEREQQVLALLEKKLEQGSYAGLIIEPLVQGASGMRMCRSEFLQQLAQIAQKHDLLLIFDEVMTGFGRTGDWFACIKSQVAPDILCLSKGITGGFLPLSVTVSSERIYQAFYSDDPTKTLYHGHSYAANPIGCAAALASLDLMIEHEPAFRSLEANHLHYLNAFYPHPKLEKLRVTGTIVAMDIRTAEQPGYLNQVTMQIRKQAIEQGLLLRPLGNVLYVMPPYCITTQELGQVYQGIEAILGNL